MRFRSYIVCSSSFTCVGLCLTVELSDAGRLEILCRSRLASPGKIVEEIAKVAVCVLFAITRLGSGKNLCLYVYSRNVRLLTIGLRICCALKCHTHYVKEGCPVTASPIHGIVRTWLSVRTKRCVVYL